MRLVPLDVALLLICAVLILPVCTSTDSDTFAHYLPAEDSVEGWIAVDTVQVFVGQDLFLMINGGAETYHKYGFIQAATREYAGPHDLRLNVEVYEMTDTAAADSIYAYKTGDKGMPLTIGTEGQIEGYFLNFKKGRFVVTAVGFDSDSLTHAGLLALARETDARLP